MSATGGSSLVYLGRFSIGAFCQRRISSLDTAVRFSFPTRDNGALRISHDARRRVSLVLRDTYCLLLLPLSLLFPFAPFVFSSSSSVRFLFLSPLLLLLLSPCRPASSLAFGPLPPLLSLLSFSCLSPPFPPFFAPSFLSPLSSFCQGGFRPRAGLWPFCTNARRWFQLCSLLAQICLYRRQGSTCNDHGALVSLARKRRH